MTLFPNATTQQVWIGHTCHRCWRFTHDCPILERALRTDRKPREWQRNPRAQLMQDSMKCDEFATRPPLKRKGEKQFEDVPLFDVTPYVVDIGFVPVEGWPDKPGKDKGVDHA